MAEFMGKDVKKLKAKGGGKWKYMSEQDMLRHSEKFAPYRWVTRSLYGIVHFTKDLVEVYSCGICGESKT